MIRFVYNLFRDRLPVKTATYNGIPVRDARLLDITTSHPGHKDVLLDAIRKHVQPSDNVCVIGGGRGLAAAVSAQTANHTTVYEASREQCERTRETIGYLSLSTHVTMKQAVVGGEIDVWGDSSHAVHVPVSQLGGDVWIVDIEGGEYSLVRELTGKDVPRVLIIETHEIDGESRNDLVVRLSEWYEDVSVSGLTDDSTALGGPVVIAAN